MPPESEAAEVCQDDLRPGVVSGALITSQLGVVSPYRMMYSIQECQNYHRILVLPQGKGQISSPDGQIWNVSDTILACSSNAYYPLCHYRNVRRISCYHAESGILINLIYLPCSALACNLS